MITKPTTRSLDPGVFGLSTFPTEKTGYRGHLRKDAQDKEVQDDYYDAACDYAMLGEKDAAFVALARAAAAGQQVDFLKLDPDLDNVRSDPRYADLLRRIGLPQ